MTDNVALIEGGGDGSKARSTFKAHSERIGRLVEFDGDVFVIAFELPVRRHTPQHDAGAAVDRYWKNLAR